MKAQTNIAEPINFRRRLKLLRKEIQRAGNNYDKQDEILKDFRARSGLFIPYVSYIHDLLKLEFRGSALARVCRAALKMDSYVDARDILRKNTILREVPFCKIQEDRIYFYQDM